MSEEAELRLGQYGLFSAASPKDHFVGRSPHEERSLLPKPVLNLPRPDPPVWPVWTALRFPDGTHELRINEAPTGSHDKAVYAFINGEPPARWIVTPAWTTDGQRGYTIELQLLGGKVGWVSQGINEEEPGQPITLHPLTPTKSLPPQYPPTQVFIFKRLVLEGEQH